MNFMLNYFFLQENAVVSKQVSPNKSQREIEIKVGKRKMEKRLLLIKS